MMDNNQLIRYICRCIKRARFCWRNYLQPSSYYGREIAVTPLFYSYGQIGYSIHFPYSNLPKIDYDWELEELTVDDMDWEEYFNDFLK